MWVHTEEFARWGQQVGLNLLRAIRDLFRVTRVDRPDALLAAPQEAYFLREQLRLHLMSARLAAMWRNDVLFRTDTDRASLLLQRYFDPEQRLVGAQLESLKQLQSMRLSLDQQALAETLTAIRSARSARDARTAR
jgi:uroporphyrin-3 C-methyltransferase